MFVESLLAVLQDAGGMPRGVDARCADTFASGVAGEAFGADTCEVC